jgi:hypothetical protein
MQMLEASSSQERERLTTFMAWIGILYGFLFVDLIQKAVDNTVQWNLGSITMVIVWCGMFTFIAVQTMCVWRMADLYLKYRVRSKADCIKFAKVNVAPLVGILACHFYLIYFPAMVGHLPQNADAKIGLSVAYVWIDLILLAVFAILMIYVKLTSVTADNVTRPIGEMEEHRIVMTDSSDESIFRKAKKLGLTPQDESYVEFEQRVLSAMRERRESRFFAIALISALASVLSALAAWFAVVR